MTKVLHGSVSILEELAKEWDAKSVLLVMGREQRVVPDLPALIVNVSPNPDQDALRHLDEEVAALGVEPDLVVGVGGGSAMDVAKVAASQRDLPCFVAPTTAGTGAEVTPFATVYRDGVKESVGCRAPWYAVLDPELTMTMPREVAASSGLDALCQGIESLWSIKSTAESRAYSRECIRLAVDNIHSSVDRPTVDNRRAMLQAANLSGRAIAIAGTTLAHAMSYRLTSQHGIPHGIAVARMIDEVLVQNFQVTAGDCADPRGPAWVKERCDEVSKAVQWFGGVTDIMDNLGVQPVFDQAGQYDWSRADPVRAANNPRRLT